MCRGPIMPQMDAPSNPAEPHGRVTQPLLERCVHVAGAPLDPRRPCGGARPARCGSTRRPSARCLPFTVPVLGTSHLLILRVGFLFSRLPDCGPPPRCRDRFATATGASTRRTFSSGDRQLTTGVFPSARPRRRDPPRPRPLPRAHPSPHGVPHRLPACPACARRLAEPARFPPRPLAPPPLRPPLISSPRHAR